MGTRGAAARVVAWIGIPGLGARLRRLLCRLRPVPRWRRKNGQRWVQG